MPGEERCEFSVGERQCVLRWGHDGICQIVSCPDQAEGERDAAQKRFESYADLNDEVIADNEDLRTQLTARDVAGAALYAFAEKMPHRHDCMAWKIGGDPCGSTSIGPNGVTTTARPWRCFCGRDDALAIAPVAWRK